MAHIHHTPAVGRPERPHWRRARKRRWSRPDDAASSAALFAAIPSLPRSALSRLTAAMIDRLDEIDGDPDVEDDDPGGDNVLDAEDWRSHGNDEWVATRPIYGVDQSLGPINEEEARREHMQRLSTLQ